MSASSLGWALVVVGSLLTMSGGILVWVGQQLITAPERLSPPVAVSEAVQAPVLNARQHRLLQRIWELQQEFSAEYVVLGMTGKVHLDDVPQEHTASVDLKVELLGGEPVPEGTREDPAFEALVDSMPAAYLRRLDREDPGKHLRWGRNVVVTVSGDGIRYLRGS